MYRSVSEYVRLCVGVLTCSLCRRVVGVSIGVLDNIYVCLSMHGCVWGVSGCKLACSGCV